MEIDTHSLYQAFKRDGFVCFMSGETKYIVFHYPQVLSQTLKQKAAWADHVICCHPLDFQRDYPMFAEKVIGTWDKVTMVHFEKKEILVRQIKERMTKQKMVVLRNNSETTVVSENEYLVKYQEKFSGTIFFLAQGDEMRFPKVGRFTSELNMFLLENNYVVISWNGTTNELKFEIDWRSAMRAVKRAIENSNLSFEEFMAAAYRLHQAGEL
jgi:hypothetical protein